MPRDNKNDAPESSNPNTPPVAGVDSPVQPVTGAQFDNQPAPPATWEERRDRAMAILNSFQATDQLQQNFVAQLRAALA